MILVFFLYFEATSLRVRIKYLFITPASILAIVAIVLFPQPSKLLIMLQKNYMLKTTVVLYDFSFFLLKVFFLFISSRFNI